MPDPMYRRIAEDLRQKIESGDLGHGTQLPTELELRDRYDASRNTVRDAVRWLITRGLVETRPGQGTFVVEKIDPFITTLTAELETGLGGEGAAYASEVIQQAAGVIARKLRLDDGSTVVSRHQQRLIDGTAYSLQTTFYPMRLVEQGALQLIQAQDMPAGTVRYLEETLAIKQIGCRDTITVRAPDATEAAFFKLADDGRIAVFEIFQTGFDERGRPMRLTVSVYPTDRNQFAINVGQVPDEVAEPRSITEAGVPPAETAELGGSG